jgi:hypothetical protein
MKPTRIEFDAGTDKYGRRITLTRAADGAWSIYREAANQRDENQCVGDLPAESILRMAEAVKEFGR